VAKVRELAATLADDQIAAALNQQNHRSSQGKTFNVSMIRWIRYRHRIPPATRKHSGEFSVQETAHRFGVSIHVVYYWIERGILQARRIKKGSPYWIRISDKEERELFQWVKQSSKIRNKNEQHS
jgi:hypothetical protein